MIFKLKSADLATLLKALLQSPLALVLGWCLAGFFFVIGSFVIRVQRDFYQREIDRLRHPTKGLAHEAQTVLPLAQTADVPPCRRRSVPSFLAA